MNAVTFFYRHAGWSYPAGATPKQQRAHRLNQARRMAAAEVRARDSMCSFEWSVDDARGSAEWSDETPAWESWQCVMRNIRGENVASLHGIDFGRDGSPWCDPYRRVVESELALECEA